MTDPGVYCSAPWTSVTVRENGDVRTCCAGHVVAGNLNNDSIQTIINSSKWNEIKAQLLHDAHVNCESCVASEAKTKYSSLRQHYLKYYPIKQVSSNKLKFIDIRWNNKCNLACQYCEPALSSVWQDRLGIQKSSAVKDYQEDLLDWIVTNAEHVNEVMLVGGEPMLMKQNHVLFQTLPDNCQISIITNLSYDLERLPCIEDLLKRPRNKIIWNVSMENIGEQFEYVRTGADWHQVEKNFKFLMKHWPTTISINMVYSLFSALNLNQTIKHFSSWGVNKFTLLQLGDNDEINVFNMSPEIKALSASILQQVQQWHQDCWGSDTDLYPISGLVDLHNGLLNNCKPATITQPHFFAKINWYDSWAPNKKFKELWPEVVQLVQQTL